MKKINLNLHDKAPRWAENSFFVFMCFFTLFIFVQTVKSAEIILDPVKKVPVVAPTTSSVFTRVLSFSMTGQDVSALQTILTIANGIQVPVTGIFGDITKTALKVFQAKYPIDILIPAGLSVPNGIVGSTTMVKLNQLAAQYNVKLSDFSTGGTATPVSVTSVFNRDLKLGDTGDDVILLKQVLNSDFSTALMYLNNTAPAGSENLFDDATQGSVIRFQEKYASEILTPRGLAQGTGIVDATTRTKLNKILVSSATFAIKNDTRLTNINTSTTTAKQLTVLPQGNYVQGVVEQPTVDKKYPYVYWTTRAWGACTNSGWTQCSEEGNDCKVTNAPQAVKYGVNYSWVYKNNLGGSTPAVKLFNIFTIIPTGSRPVPCNNKNFGDPAENIKKACYQSNGVKTRTVIKNTTYYTAEVINTQTIPEDTATCNYVSTETSSTVVDPCGPDKIVPPTPGEGCWIDIFGWCSAGNTFYYNNMVAACKANNK